MQSESSVTYLLMGYSAGELCGGVCSTAKRPSVLEFNTSDTSPPRGCNIKWSRLDMNELTALSSVSATTNHMWRPALHSHTQTQREISTPQEWDWQASTEPLLFNPKTHSSDHGFCSDGTAGEHMMTHMFKEGHNIASSDVHSGTVRQWPTQTPTNRSEYETRPDVRILSSKCVSVLQRFYHPTINITDMSNSRLHLV